MEVNLIRKLLTTIFTILLLTSTLNIAPAVGLQACNALPFSDESDHILFGRPVLRVNAADAPTTIDLLIRNTYELRNHGDNKFADWVAYFLDGSTFGEVDPEEEINYGNDLCINPNRTLEADPSDADDFSNSDSAGYLRGHLASNLTFAGTPSGSDLNLYSNIVPMHEGIVDAWNEFEQVVRDFVIREETSIYVIAGPAYRVNMPNLPGADEDHRVPSGYWKFVYLLLNDSPDSLRYRGIWLDQSGCLSEDEDVVQTCVDKNNDWRNNPIRWVDVEGFTRFDFLTHMNNTSEQRVERLQGFLELE